jgi:peptidase E
VNHLNINQSYEELKKEILGTDIIYIGGGNTKYLINKLKETGIDKLLIQAYNNGIVCSGLSAGSYCWFKYNYDLLEGMGVINAINCVNYDQKDSDSKNKFYNVIKDTGLVGYALDNCVALEFIDDEIKIVKSDENKNAYKVIYNNNEISEKIIV